MASQTITGPTLQYTQDNKHCFAYSGLFLASTDQTTTYLEFTTGSGVIVGMLQLNAPVDDDDPANTTIAAANIKLNDISVAIIRAGLPSASDTPTSISQQLIIPQLTRVKITVDCSSTEVDRYASVVFTGKVYEYLNVRN